MPPRRTAPRRGAATPGGRGRWARRGGYGAYALFQLAFIVTELVWSPNRDKNRRRLWAPLLFLALPDAPLLAGGGAGRARGRAGSLYTRVHRLWPGPTLLTAAGFLWPDSPCFLAGLGWGAHVALERAVDLDGRDGRGPGGAA
ncbi:MAG TPA: hypothetical protein VFW96_25085 [Thermomicrobiales bacterium]|nr:hypothetical protein [Thermomicrobiales bacterium]